VNREPGSAQGTFTCNTPCSVHSQVSVRPGALDGFLDGAH